jgi:hypothetical protein
MTDTPLIRRLRLQPGRRAAFIHAPEGFVASLGLPESVTVTDRLDAPCDYIQVFARHSAELAAAVPAAVAALKPDGILWFCYPKTTSGVETDLTRDAGWAAVEAAGLRPVSQVALDATWSALRFRKETRETPEAGIEAQYAGAKAGLRPIYDRLETLLSGWPGVSLVVRQTYVAFARGKQFAVVQPSTRTRVDVGLKLPGAAAGERLLAATNTGSGSMTHRVAVSSVEAIDEELVGWLRRAYDEAGR